MTHLGSSRLRTLSSLSGILSVLLLTGAAQAHIDLLEPSARVPGGFSGTQKAAPCGDENGLGRTEASTHVFAPGEEIEIKIAESIDHPAYYRVAFSLDGETFPERADPGSATQGTDDPELEHPVDGETILAYQYEDPETDEYTFNVTLPNVECEQCTLQVIQFMYDKPNAPYYYQCADLALRSTGEPVAEPDPTTGGQAMMPEPETETLEPEGMAGSPNVGMEPEGMTGATVEPPVAAGGAGQPDEAPVQPQPDASPEPTTMPVASAGGTMGLTPAPEPSASGGSASLPTGSSGVGGDMGLAGVAGSTAPESEMTSGSQDSGCSLIQTPTEPRFGLTASLLLLGAVLRRRRTSPKSR